MKPRQLIFAGLVFAGAAMGCQPSPFPPSPDPTLPTAERTGASPDLSPAQLVVALRVRRPSPQHGMVDLSAVVYNMDGEATSFPIGKFPAGVTEEAPKGDELVRIQLAGDADPQTVRVLRRGAYIEVRQKAHGDESEGKLIDRFEIDADATVRTGEPAVERVEEEP